jgi:hypothetical protein
MELLRILESENMLMKTLLALVIQGRLGEYNDILQIPFSRVSHSRKATVFLALSTPGFQ